MLLLMAEILHQLRSGLSCLEPYLQDATFLGGLPFWMAINVKDLVEMTMRVSFRDSMGGSWTTRTMGQFCI